MSKAADFLKVYRSGEGDGGRRLVAGGGGSRSFVLLSVLVVLSVCLSASGEIKIHWYIPADEANRLGIKPLSE
jgi:hypothetical protein